MNKIREMQAATKKETGLPGALQEKLSEGNSLLTTLPAEVSDRLNYLESNRNLRLEYKSLKDKLEKWIQEADQKVQKGHLGVDFDSLFADLEDHKVSDFNYNNMI